MAHKLFSKTSYFGVMFFILTGLMVSSCSGNNRAENDGVLSSIDSRDIPIHSEMEAELTNPPFVPPSTANRQATKLKVDLEILEGKAQLMNGVDYIYWTFGGTVPGSFIRAKLGDEIEMTLKNHPDNQLPHNIDLHAVNGPGGGAVSSFVAPGHEITFSFKALHAGLYVYHCATAPVGMHIANGMYGLILVEPTEGLPEVDHEYYVMQGEFYTKGKFGEKGEQPFDMKKAIDENPDYVLFNGQMGALMGKKALTAKVGETVRLYVGNGGPNLVSSFHVIGEIMDQIHIRGGKLVDENVQTALIPAGGAAIVEFKVDAPGEYILVDHSIFRAFNKGAMAQLMVSGEKDESVYKGTIQEGIYLPEGSAIQSMPMNQFDKQGDLESMMSREERKELGHKIYDEVCFACHQPKGQGIPDAFPPLANSDYLNEDVDRAIRAVVFGLSGEITVNGKKYNSVMPSQALEDNEVAAVMTYIYSQWGNNRTDVTEEMVRKVKE